MSENRDRALLEYEAEKKARQRLLRSAPTPEGDLFELAGWLTEGAAKAQALAADIDDTEVSRQVNVLRDQTMRLGQLLAMRRRAYGNSTAAARSDSDSARRAAAGR